MDQATLTEWVAGFYDGEGCVEVSLSKNDGYAVGYGINPQTRISQNYIGGLFDAEGHLSFGVTESADHNVGYSACTSARIGHAVNDPLLEALGKFADEIGVDDHVHFRERDENGLSDVFHWGISKRHDLRIFLKEIRPHCIVKADQIDIMLDEIYPRIESGFASNKRQFLELIAWRDVMNAPKGGLRGKYNLEYFEDLWGMSLEADKLPDAHPRNTSTTEVRP